jgi:uncharacterized protein YfaS (alpha-2-macroglobulin family)
VRASLPVSVRLYLPRFAVESDRLEAVALVFNSGKAERACEVCWEVERASADGALRQKVTVPANGSARVGLWLKCDRVGAARVSVRLADGADAEVRSLPVQPLGRDHEVTLDGAFTRSHKVTLPPGFTARDLTLVLARGEVARSLEGIGGLVDYPHGCVEQTMSRFLPAVVVRQATRQAPVALPPEVAAKLPEVVERGLARLYGFQHADGGWGWWEADRTDPRMTIYVVHGLATARLSGLLVDEGVLGRGCGWVAAELRGGRVPPHLIGRAWLALALAGQANLTDLGLAADAALEADAPAERRARLALACRASGRAACRCCSTARPPST